MKNRVLQAVLLGLALGGLLLGTTPAQAATLSWEDPSGDAYPEAETIGPSPLSEPSYDVTKVTMSSDGTTLTWRADITGLAADPPPRATGIFFDFEFVVGEDAFSFYVMNDRINGPGNQLYFQGEFLEDTPCAKCTGKMDLESSSVTFTAPIESLKSGIRQLGATKDFGPGSKMEQVSVNAGGIYNLGAVLFYLAHDSGPAPEPATFTV